MAVYYARKAGNINATDVWATTPTGTAGEQTFAAGDVLVANSFAITVNVSTDLGATGEVRNDTTGTATAGGSFALSNGVTLTANVIAGTVSVVTLTSTNSATIVGNVTGGTSANAYGVNHSSSGTITITGNVTGGSGASAFGLNMSTANGKATITGNVAAGSGSAATGVYPDASGQAVTVTGNVTGGASANAAGIRARSSSAITVTGNVTGGSAAAGILVETTGSITVTGTAIGGTGSPGISGGTTATVAVTRAKGGATAGSGVGLVAVTTGTSSVEEIEYGDLGASPTSGPVQLVAKTSNVALFYVPSAAKKTLVDANAGGLMPAASNVRSGVVYNGGNSTGTCAVPGAASVLVGVPVDATVGTAAVASADIQSGCAAALSAFSSGRLSNCATVASVGQQLADALTTP